MFKKVNVPILGVVENMSHFICPTCSTKTPIFAPKSALDSHTHSVLAPKMADLGIPLLGSIPLSPNICADADAGKPTVVAEPESERSQALEAVAAEVCQKLGL
jgi:ATP-binding protein involved in chromosome partitioning